MTTLRYVVLVTKLSSGVDVVFNVYADEKAAQSTVRQLAGIGCAARIAPARTDDSPGAARRPRRES